MWAAASSSSRAKWRRSRRGRHAARRARRLARLSAPGARRRRRARPAAPPLLRSARQRTVTGTAGRVAAARRRSRRRARHLGGAPLTLVGYSWGALLAMLYATEHPEHVAQPGARLAGAGGVARARRIQSALRGDAKRPSVQALRERLDPRDRRHRFALAVAGYFANPELAVDLTPFVVKQSAEEAVWRSLGEYDLRRGSRPRRARLRRARRRRPDPDRHRARRRPTRSARNSSPSRAAATCPTSKRPTC